MIGESGTPAGTLEGMDEQRADQLRIRLVQRASGLDPAENLAALEEIAALPGHPDLVVLPEAFARDFGQPGSDLSAFAEPLDGPFAQRLRALSSSTGSAWLAGMFETADDASRPLNTLLLADGERLAAYRKIHLYDSFGYQESDTVSPGAVEPVVVDVRGFPIGLMTCYDLRFPELARALAERGAEVVVVPAAWVAGKRKVEHWRTLLRARAIENTVWVVAVGQPGPRYTGHSLVVAPDGDVVAEADVDEVVIDARIDRAAVEDVRRTNPSLANRRM
jgi:predicted amidohydrolase